MSKCPARKKDGSPCTLDAVYADNRCWAHSEHTAENRRKGRSRGGRNRSGSGELTEVKGQLKALIANVLSGAVERGVGAVALQGYGVLLKAFDLERRVRETDELDAKLDEMEKRLELARQGRYGV